MASVLSVPAKSVDPDGNINLCDQLYGNATPKGGSRMLN